MTKVLATTVALAAAWACAPGDEPVPPNLLLVTIDTLRADHLGTYGYARDTSARIDQFAEQAVVFERAYSSSSWTLPALCSLMSARHVSTHRCCSNTSRLRDSFRTLAECLADAGYRTAAVVTHVFLARRHGLAQGFAEYDDELVAELLEVSHRSVTSPAITSRGKAWLERHARDSEGPWFLWLHYFDPHDQYLVHPTLTERFGTTAPVDRYDGEIAFTDAAVGRVLDQLGELGADERTVVAILADHGEEFGDHGGRGHRNTVYEEVLRVPWLLRAPSLAPRRVARPVAMVDVGPTLLGLLGVDVRLDGGDGLDLTPWLRAGRPLPERSVLGELGPDRWDTLIQGDWKLIRQRGARPTLFDLATDAREREDRSPDLPGRVARMRAELTDLKRACRTRSDAFGELSSVHLSSNHHEALEALGYGGD